MLNRSRLSPVLLEYFVARDEEFAGDTQLLFIVESELCR